MITYPPVWTPSTPGANWDDPNSQSYYEAVAKGRLPGAATLATPSKRILATIVDGLSYQLVWGGLWLLGVADSLMVGSTAGFGLLIWLTGLMLWRAIWVWRVGATPGKLLLGLRVADARTGERPSLKAASLRTIDGTLWMVGALGAGFAALGSTFAALMMLASLVLLFKDPRRQTVNDHLADTIVIQS